MSDCSDSSSGKYKWTPESTQLLVSVWSDRQVQKQLEYTSKPTLIWESVARYMKKKGYEVTAKQCKSRMKQVLVCYREAKKSGTRNGVERYYESIDKVLESKRSDQFETNKNNNNNNGVDTVDSTNVNFKSPPKELKTNANLRMRQNKLEEPNDLHNIEVIPGPWQYEREDYPDSSESNETVVVRPCRPFSPLKDVGTNTVSDSMKLIGKSVRRSLNPTDDRFRYENVETNRFSELPLKIQNVQNHIIQENMLMKNQLYSDNIGYYPPTEYRMNMNNPGLRPTLAQNIVYNPQRISTNMARMQSQLQQYTLGQNSAMPQEPKKFVNFVENPALNTNPRSYKTYAEVYSPDIAPNLNEGFYQATQTRKLHNLNETYDQDMYRDEGPVQMNTTTITNNATFNDDTISIEFLQDSPSPTENDRAVKTNSNDGQEDVPNAPERKKKTQKIELLMLNAINSQSEVVNKILAAQDSMVSKLLDLDKDRQNRLETRLDQLMTVVQATVLNKSGDSSKSDNNRVVTPPPAPPLQFERPTCFSPPPKPGTQPPKLDLVPPKPCRVPCTTANNVDLINQNGVQTRPNIGSTRPGTIWSKLGPVSQSPFVKAQQQISAVTKAADHWRTKSSAERRIAQSNDPFLNHCEIIEETAKFVEREKLMEERIENARHFLIVDNDQSARRKLFQNEDNVPEQKEVNNVEKKRPSAEVVMTSTFLDLERKAEEKLRLALSCFESDSDSDDLLTGQGESYERLRRLSVRPKIKNYQPKMNTSTPAKNDLDDDGNEPRQTIQQLAELVMNSARWRNDAINGNKPKISKNIPSNNIHDIPPKKPPRDFEAQRLSREKAIDWLQERYNYGIAKNLDNNYPIGFHIENLKNDDSDLAVPTIDQLNPNNIGFNRDILPPLSKMQSLDFIENEMKTYERLQQMAAINSQIQARVLENNAKMLNKQKEEEDDDEFLDTTTTFHSKRKNSLTSGTSFNKQSGCIIS